MPKPRPEAKLGGVNRSGCRKYRDVRHGKEPPAGYTLRGRLPLVLRGWRRVF